VIQPERLKDLNHNPIQQGDYVLYWMQQAQRAEYNHALEFAIYQANQVSLPLLVAFGLMDNYPEANLRHYSFMLEGLKDVQEALQQRGIKLVVQLGSPVEVAIKLAQKAALVVCDRGYLRIQKHWYSHLVQSVRCRVIQVETDVVVPVELASDKCEYAARTIRPKIQRQLERFLCAVETIPVRQTSLHLNVDGLELNEPQMLAHSLKLNQLAVSPFFKGGASQARAVLASFLAERFERYSQNRNQPQINDSSLMAMYLHFGQISPLDIALQVRQAGGSQQNTETYLEELIIRRELAINFVHFCPNYDSYSCLPDWASKTLGEHRHDKRVFCYDRETLEVAQTHDRYWNAAMQEMFYTGYMHNYMRMYWGKKILEWSASPEEAFETALYLNNRYFLDGRDANSFAGVAWCFGLHDRPWAERPILGTVRYMNATGLVRKADPEAYVNKVNQLVGVASRSSHTS
jgi:deoxyribodipyrimidine photo-lyase